MSLENISNLGVGGSGLSGQSSGSAFAAIQEVEGLTFSLLAGANANTKIDLASIRSADTVIAALNNNAGVITDILSTISIVGLYATGTLTLTSNLQDGDTVQTHSRTYTAKTAPVASNYLQFKIGADSTATAVNLAAAINLAESAPGHTQWIVATSATNVVTITAVVEGTGPNAYNLVGNARCTASAATLAGGGTTGGIKSTGATDQVLLVWFNKRPA